MKTLDAALAYAALGWQVFPAVVGVKKSHKAAEFSNGRNWGMTILLIGISGLFVER